jgi:copper(I)-binding protein
MIRNLLPAVLAVTGLAASAQAAESGLMVMAPWSRPAGAGMTGVGYLTLMNHGRAAAVLTGAESPAAARVEIHNASMSGGVMRMEKTPQVVIPAGGEVAFAPGGRHLMLIGLKAALKPGDRAPLTLLFADGRRLKTELAVGTGLGPPDSDHTHR